MLSWQVFVSYWFIIIDNLIKATEAIDVWANTFMSLAEFEMQMFSFLQHEYEAA